MRCARHPDVETELTCSSCGTPICPRCSVPAPVGIKCPECARPARTDRQVPPLLFLRALAITLPVSLFGGVIIQSGFLPFIGALIHGWVVGEAAFASSSRRSGPVIESLAGVCAVAGIVLASVLLYLSNRPPGAFSLPLALGLTNLWNVWVMIISGVVAVSRVRYR